MYKKYIIFPVAAVLTLCSLTIGCSEKKSDAVTENSTENSQSSCSELSDNSNGYDSPEEVITALYEIANECMAEPFDESAKKAAEKIYDLYYEPEIEMVFRDLSKGREEIVSGYSEWVSEYYQSIQELGDSSVLSSWKVNISEPHEWTDVHLDQDRYSFAEIGLEKSNMYQASFAESSDENAREVYILSNNICCNEYGGKWYISCVG